LALILPQLDQLVGQRTTLHLPSLCAWTTSCATTLHSTLPPARALNPYIVGQMDSLQILDLVVTVTLPRALAIAPTPSFAKRHGICAIPSVKPSQIASSIPTAPPI